MGTHGTWDSETELRAIRLVTARKQAVRPNGRVAFMVRSSADDHDYQVVVDDSGWSCTCPAWVDRSSPCKHIVETVIWLDPNPATVADAPVGPKRKTYSQPDWPAYDEGQQLEHDQFDRYLWDLLGGIHEMPWPAGKRGRPVIPLRTQALMAVRKVHLAMSMRRARGLMVALNRDGKGVLPRVPNYSQPARFFNRPAAPGILTDLIERSGLVLKEVEDRGTVAIDSSGFSTSTRGSYYTERYEPERRHRFVKLHLAIGVKTHIVLSAKVTDEHGGDSPQFVPLLSRVEEIGHTPSKVVADKAYLSRANLTAAGELGIDPFIPFKVNSRTLAAGSPMWNRKAHEFALARDQFDKAYHQRSNVEATFSAIKRKLGEPLLSRKGFARMNELLAKVLAYNVGVVIAQARLYGIDGGATPFIPKTTHGAAPSYGVAA